MRGPKWIWTGLSVLMVILGSGLGGPAEADEGIPSYYSNLNFNLTGPGALATSVGGAANPAVLRMLPEWEYHFLWSGDGATFRSIPQWGFFSGGQNLGFSMIHTRFDPGSGSLSAGVTDYRLSLALGDKDAAIGVGFGWAGGDEELAGRYRMVQLGAVRRYGRYLSLGTVGTFSTQTDAASVLYDVAVRPFGDRRLTVFADAELQRDTRLDDALWSAGAVIEPVPGVQLIGRYFEDESLALSVGLNLGAVGVTASPRFDRHQDYHHTVYGLRLGYDQDNLADRYLKKNQAYLHLNLTGDIRYRTFRLFDDESKGFRNILQALEDARRDPRVAGVTVNLSGANVSRGKAWELSQKLLQLRLEGKKVVAFIDQATMNQYHIAAAADRIVMDPIGVVLITGYLMGRTFLLDGLHKLGLEVDEWRFFEYKSAFEGFSRRSMTEADRKQRLALIQGYYDEFKTDVQSSRQVSDAEFGNWVNEEWVFTAEQALAAGLVDNIGGFDQTKDVIKELEGSAKGVIAAKQLAGRKFPSTLWGENPEIALVYGLGVCAMDEGIKARQLAGVFNRLANDRGVKAVVFRVDSPGGDATASDLVAEALKKCAEKKPVVVSQGDVAGSGGYWISMYGTKILAQPTTITGSIGVIGGWIWNDGLGGKLGLISDHVKVGEHADLGFGIRLPLVGLGVPDRNLTAEERQKMADLFQVMYTSFVDRVAAGRNLEPEDVRRIGEGRVWTGRAGVENGLIDRIGGLEQAIQMARSLAGLSPGETVDVKEYPPAPIFDLAALFGRPRLLPFSLGSLLGTSRNDSSEPQNTGESEDYVRDYEWMVLKAVAGKPGQPLYMVPPELLPREGLPEPR